MLLLRIKKLTSNQRSVLKTYSDLLSLTMLLKRLLKMPKRQRMR